MKYTFIFSILLLLLFGISEQVSACSCAANISACQRLGYADAIFVGKAVSAKTEGMKQFTTFEVEETISGAKTKTFVVQNREGSSCDTSFAPGENYIVFANGDDKKGYRSFACAGNALLSEAQDLLTELKNLPPKGSGGKIYGIVYESLKTRSEESVPMSGVDITIREIGGKSKTYKAVTDTEGKYQLIVPPGKYKVTPTVPVYAKLDDYSADEITVKDQSCQSKNFGVSNKSQVSGKIVDADGKPVTDIRIELVAVDEAPEPFGGEGVYSEENGEFVIPSVPAGRYTLSVNFTVNPDLETPFRTSFYPQVFERSEAKVFDIGLGQSVDNLIFRLPPRIKTQKITGKVVFPDGAPAANITVNLQEEDSNNSFSYTRTDENGDFTLEGFSGEKYNFGIDYYGDERGKDSYFVKKTVFTLDEKTPAFRLVMEKKPKE